MLLASLITSIAIVSCEPEGPWTHYSLISTTTHGAHSSSLIAPPCCVTIHCEEGGSGCQKEVDKFEGACAEFGVCVETSLVDSIYKYYGNNAMSSFYTAFDIEEIFPILNTYRPYAKDSLVNGNYRLHVLADSSIVIVKSPLDSVSFNNIVFAYDVDNVIEQ